MAANKAPAGGMIVNSQFYVGGRFLPRLLKRIRTVRRNARPVQLSRGKQQIDSSKIYKLPLRLLSVFDKNLRKGFFHVDSGKVSKTPNAPLDVHYLPEKKKFILTDGHHRLIDHLINGATHVPVKVIGRGYTDYWADPTPEQEFRFTDGPFKGLEDVADEEILEDLKAKRKPPQQLTRDPEAPPASIARVLPSGARTFEMGAIPDETLAEMEKEYDVPERLKLTTNKRTVEQLHKFLDHVGKRDIPKGLKGEKQFHHLLAHALSDAGSYQSVYSGQEWYGGSIQKLEHGLHDLLSREKPFDPKSDPIRNHVLWGKKGDKTAALRLFKMIVGFTSNNQSPKDNLSSALKILKTGLEKDDLHPFEHMEEYNEKPKQVFLEHLTKKHGPGDHSLVDSNWHKKYGEDLRSFTKHSSGPVSMVIGLEDSKGNVVGRVNLAGKQVAFDGTPLPKGKYKEVPYPSVGEDGRLKAKGWSSRASTNAAHIRLLKRIIAETGGYEQAANWLEERHPHAEVEAVKGGPVKRGELLKDEDTPGMFVFGEKQGPFFSNISGNPEHVTQDVWWTRAINRWLGKLTKNNRTPNTSQKQFYARIAREASKTLGLSPADLQAALWYAEQHLYRLFGVRADSEDFAQAIKHAKSAHGFEK